MGILKLHKCSHIYSKNMGISFRSKDENILDFLKVREDDGLRIAKLWHWRNSMGGSLYQTINPFSWYVT